MSIKAVTYFQAQCDWPDQHPCESQPNYEYSAWSDEAYVEEEMLDANWWEGRDGKTHYCDTHPATWASDHELGEPFPEPPYLLIHDDVKVTYVGGAR